MKVSCLLVGVWAYLGVLWANVEGSPCCGLVVGGLAFAGGVALGKHHHRHHHHHGGGGCRNCGCGGCGGSCGWCGGSYGKRRRRSADFITFLEDAEIKQAYNKIAAEDKDECGLRLVCELAQKDPRDLADDEIKILLPYRGAGKSDGTVYGNYDEAAWHGQEGHKCPTFYSLCAFSADKIMVEFRKYSANNQTFTLN